MSTTTINNSNTFSEASFFQPATLPAPLIKLYEALADAPNDQSRHQAALAIIHEYFSFFGPTGMRQDMWQLLSTALCNKQSTKLKKASNRRNLLFFYEFTLLLVDAVFVIGNTSAIQTKG